MIELSRNKSISDAVLISGDEDIHVGVELAQGFGVRVHLLGIADVEHNVSRGLRWAVDTIGRVESQWFSENFRCYPASPGGGSVEGVVVVHEALHEAPPGGVGLADDSRAADSESLEQTAWRVATQLTSGYSPEDFNEIRAYMQLRGGIPPELDRPLLAAVSRVRAGQRFAPEEKSLIRQAMREHIGKSLKAEPETKKR